jgi:hypothetical protein
VTLDRSSLPDAFNARREIAMLRTARPSAYAAGDLARRLLPCNEVVLYEQWGDRWIPRELTFPTNHLTGGEAVPLPLVLDALRRPRNEWERLSARLLDAPPRCSAPSRPDAGRGRPTSSKWPNARLNRPFATGRCSVSTSTIGRAPPGSTPGTGGPTPAARNGPSPHRRGTSPTGFAPTSRDTRSWFWPATGTRNGIDGGCVKAAFTSGRQAARATCGEPRFIPGEDGVLERH